MIRYRAGFAPVADEGEKLPTVAAKTSAAPTLPTVEEAKARAAARQTQVLDYTRQKGEPQPLIQNLRQDGPTLEKWVEAGYKPENYPPVGYAELDSPALTEYKAKVAAASQSTPHSVNDKPEVQS
jgi:hypothetical protein